MKRILFMYITRYSGHHSASLAVEEALKKSGAKVETLSINAFNYTNPILEKIINKTYMGLIKRTPEVWEYLYDNPKVLKNTHKLRKLIHRFNSIKLKSLLTDFRPDAVVCTQAFPCGMVADYKKTYRINLPLLGILTDYAPHSYWIHDEVDVYIVACEDAKDKLIKNGISPEKIKISGLPIRPRFSHSQKREDIFNKLNFDPTLPTILVMGGGQGFGPIKEAVISLAKIDRAIQILVITGRNKNLLKWFHRKRFHLKNKTSVFGYVDNVDELMEISSIVITKPGGLTTAEALCKNLPMVIMNPIPGQEGNNARFLLNAGVAVKAKNKEELIILTEELLDNPAKLEQMKSAAKIHSKPNASAEVAKLLLEI